MHRDLDSLTMIRNTEQLGLLGPTADGSLRSEISNPSFLVELLNL